MDTGTVIERRQLHGMWASVAPAWGEHAEYADTRGAAVTDRLLELAAPRPGERALELACGPGGVGIAAARLVGPTGEVVLSDVAAEMTAIAAARRAGRGRRVGPAGPQPLAGRGLRRRQRPARRARATARRARAVRPGGCRPAGPAADRGRAGRG